MSHPIIINTKGRNFVFGYKITTDAKEDLTTVNSFIIADKLMLNKEILC